MRLPNFAQINQICMNIKIQDLNRWILLIRCKHFLTSSSSENFSKRSLFSTNGLQLIYILFDVFNPYLELRSNKWHKSHEIFRSSVNWKSLIILKKCLKNMKCFWNSILVRTWWKSQKMFKKHTWSVLVVLKILDKHIE